MALRLRRGTDADRLTITPEAGEPIYATDTKLFYMGDGTTAGGRLVAGTLEDDPTPALGANLDLNGNNITGTGNINIDGTITATGNINLGDGADDNINVGGEFVSSLTPNADSTYNLGSASARWNNIFATGMQIDGQIDAVSINSNIIANDSTVAYNAATNVLEVVTANTNTTNADTVNADTINVGDATATGLLKVYTDTSYDDTILLQHAETSANPSEITMLKVRGSHSSPVVIEDNDSLGRLTFKGFDGTYYTPAAFIEGKVTDSTKLNGGGSISDNVIPGSLQLGVMKQSGSLYPSLTIESSGAIEFREDTYTMGAEQYLRAISSIAPTRSLFLDRARGLSDTPTSVNNGDQIYNLRFRAHDGSDFVNAAIIRAEVDGTVSTGVMPARMRFIVANDTGGLTSLLQIHGRNNLISTYCPFEVNGSATIDQVQISQNNITATDSNANLVLSGSGTGTLQLEVPTQTTVGAAGAADAVPANPTTYIKINVGGTDYVIPAFAVS